MSSSSNSKALRLGMIGGGEGAMIGVAHRAAAALSGRWRLAAGAFSSDPARSRAFGPTLGLAPERAFGDWRAMLAAARELDAVAIVTPNAAHHAPARAFLEAGVAVICDKPLTTSSADADDLQRTAERTGVPLVVTYTYAGRPMIAHARRMVAEGAIGRLRVVQAEYAQAWLASPVEQAGNRQAAWRTDPAQAGPGGALADIGVHAFHLAELVAGARVEQVAADLGRFVPGRALDDNAHLLLRLEGGAKGMLWASQVAPGEANSLRLRLYGDAGSLLWSSDEPGALTCTQLGQPTRTLRRGEAGLPPALPADAPGGPRAAVMEAFTRLYAHAADWVDAWRAGRAPDPEVVRTLGVAEGARGVRFVEAAVASDRADGAWTALV